MHILRHARYHARPLQQIIDDINNRSCSFEPPHEPEVVSPLPSTSDEEPEPEPWDFTNDNEDAPGANSDRADSDRPSEDCSESITSSDQSNQESHHSDVSPVTTEYDNEESECEETQSDLHPESRWMMMDPMALLMVRDPDVIAASLAMLDRIARLPATVVRSPRYLSSDARVRADEVHTHTPPTHANGETQTDMPSFTTPRVDRGSSAVRYNRGVRVAEQRHGQSQSQFVMEISINIRIA